MEERFELSGRNKVIKFTPKDKICNEHCAGEYVFSEVSILVGKQNPPPDHPCCNHNRKQRGNDPAGSAVIESHERKATFLLLPNNKSGNQVSGDDKEHVDADVTSG